MQCGMHKIYIPGVQLVIPQHLCDELGLHLNQTVEISNSQSFRELDTRENNVSTSNSSDKTPNHYDKPLMTQPEINDKTVDWEANESSLEKHDDTFLAIAVNTENGKQIITTQNPKTSPLLSNSQTTCEGDTSEDERTSNSSDDVDTSTGKLHTVSCDTPVLTEPEINKVNEGTTNQSSFQNHGFEGMSTENNRRKYSYPRTCEICSRKYSSKNSFSKHKKNTCAWPHGKKKNKISYPRKCAKCSQMYSSTSSFSHHKRSCGHLERKKAKNLSDKTVDGEANESSLEKNDDTFLAFVENTENGKQYYSSTSFLNHKTFSQGTVKENDKCDPYETARDANRKVLYPRTCTVCNRTYSQKSSFWSHKKFCAHYAREKTNTRNLKSIEGLSSLQSLCELNTCGKNVNISNNHSDLDASAKESAALSDQEKTVKWIPVTSDSKRAQTYFVVKKTS